MDDPDNEHVIQNLLARAARMSRGHADFFDWPEKDQKEFGIAEEALLSIGLTRGKLLSRGADDPHDCEHRNWLGSIGLEITEFVDQASIEHLKRTGAASSRFWNKREFHEQLGSIVKRKDSTDQLFGRPYLAYFLVVHCDELSVSYQMAAEFLKGMRFEARIIDEIIFLFSYDPARQSYPSIRIRCSWWQRPAHWWNRLRLR